MKLTKLNLRVEADTKENAEFIIQQVIRVTRILVVFIERFSEIRRDYRVQALIFHGFWGKGTI